MNGSIYDSTFVFFFFSEILRALATRRKTKAILWCNWNPKLSPIRTIKDKSRCIDVPLLLRSFSFFFSPLNKLEHVPRSIQERKYFSIIFFFLFFSFPLSTLFLDENVVKRKYLYLSYLSLLLHSFLSFHSFIFFFFSSCFFSFFFF